MKEDNLHSILYTSCAAFSPTEDQLQHLIESAIERNQKNKITGILIYSNQNFIQYIEGPYDSLMHVYGFIRQSSMHNRIIEIYNEAISERMFRYWQMAYASTNDDVFKDLLESVLDFSMNADDINKVPNQAGKFLYEFWCKHNIGKSTNEYQA